MVFFKVVGFEIPFRSNVHTLDEVRQTLGVMSEGLRRHNIFATINPNVHTLRQARRQIQIIRRELEVQ